MSNHDHIKHQYEYRFFIRHDCAKGKDATYKRHPGVLQVQMPVEGDRVTLSLLL